MVMSNPVGRPLKFKDVGGLQSRIDEFFKDNEQPTITSLALWLDCDRETLTNYAERPEFFDTIKKAKLRCENHVENLLLYGKNATGAIFNLKNNYGWVDKTEQDITSKGEQINQPVDSTLMTQFLNSVKDDTKR